MTAPYLRIISAKGRMKMDLTDEPITIGRHAGNVLRLETDRVSRYHAVIERVGRSIRVTDLKSRNGTKVNGNRITAPVELASGDVVRIGGIDIEVIVPEAELTEESLDSETKARRKLSKLKGPVGAEVGSVKDASARSKRQEAEEVDLNSPVTRLDLEDESLEPEVTRRAPQLRSSGDDGEDNGGVDAIASLRRLADSLHDQTFAEEEVTLINARGQRVRDPEKSKSARSESRDGILVLRLLLLICARTGASDIHIEPKRDAYAVRIRVDGMMVDAAHLTQSGGARLVGVVKVLAELDIAQKQIVQEGHFSSEVPGRTIDYRVSFTPAMFGQKLVLRVLDLANTPAFLKELGLPDWMFKEVRNIIRQDAGMLLVCGPTGSGKTTTLYAGIRDIDVSQRNVITIEDPPEYQIDGVTQIPINEDQGNTFSSLLRSILRQDPDVILLGEIRDAETARIALQAAMTGHLVLSTVHAQDSIGTIFRLLDLGVEPYLVASALNLVLAQRLVRKLCDYCKLPAKPKPQQMMKMGRHGEGLKEIFYPAGCPRCLNTGYIGRRSVYELLTTNDEIRDVILKNPSMNDLRKAMKMNLFSSLKQSGFKLVADGETSIDEIDRVMGVDGRQ